MMNFEDRQLAIVKSVTNKHAYFFQDLMYLNTEDKTIVSKVYDALAINNQSLKICARNAGQSETSFYFE